VQIILFKFGKISNKHVQAIFTDYLNRLQRYCKIETIEFKVATTQSRAHDSFERMRSRVDFLVLLDERGAQMSSEFLAEWLQGKLSHPSIQSLGFAVGGPFGFSDQERQQANLIWSLSKGVFPNELAWILLAEQIYRSFSILKGSPYHHS
jgi:23S rRNA (pseudouridine1915-N3)-methyltransferase